MQKKVFFTSRCKRKPTKQVSQFSEIYKNLHSIYKITAHQYTVKSQQNDRSTQICCSQTPTSRPQGPNRASPSQGSLAGLDLCPECGGRR